MRRILCDECGVVKPTPPEDAARGLFPRRVTGQVINDLLCDLCGKVLPKGSSAIAESLPKDMGDWESQYLSKADVAYEDQMILCEHCQKRTNLMQLTDAQMIHPTLPHTLTGLPNYNDVAWQCPKCEAWNYPEERE